MPFGFKGQLSEGGGAGNGDYFWASGYSTSSTYLREYVINHEFGHTISLVHFDEIQTDGTITPYDDESDFMGQGNSLHTNAVDKYLKGWLDGSRNTALNRPGLACSGPGTPNCTCTRLGRGFLTLGQ